MFDAKERLEVAMSLCLPRKQRKEARIKRGLEILRMVQAQQNLSPDKFSKNEGEKSEKKSSTFC